ncbi:RHS repeat domain-containing protein [Paenibacillus kandeliae]|uniref:RHS repeat domain-containing protein n=1 Tax=Paenibacillus kandeliae TaxID=3231269 RepID=UPI00345899DA
MKDHKTNKNIKAFIIYVLILILSISTIVPQFPSTSFAKSTSITSIQPPSKQVAPLDVEPNSWTVVSKDVYSNVYEADDPEMKDVLSKLSSLDQYQFRGFSTFSIQEESIQHQGLTQEQVNFLISDGAEVVDVYWLEYLTRKTGDDPLEMWKQYETGESTWEQLEEGYDSGTASLPTVTDEVYTESISDNDRSSTQTVSIASTSEVDTDTKIETAFDNLLREQALASKVNAQYADTSGTKEEVTPGIGNLIWQDQQIHLPGRDGLDLNIGVTYDSSEASAYYKGHTPKGGATLYKGNLANYNYNLGVGWQFQFPYVSDVGTSKPTYYDGFGGTTGIDFEASLMGSPSESTKLIYETKISNAQGKERHFKSGGSFSNGQVGSYYFMEYADQRKEYFSDKGKIIGIVDRYGNQITFNYEPATTYASDKAEYLSSITDTIGRKIVFQYDNTLNQENFQGENVTLIVYDPSGREVQRVVYTKSRMALTNQNQGTSDGYAPLLSKITNSNEDVKTFDYDMQTSQFRYYATKGYASQPFALLKNVYYPRSSTQYAYALGAHDFGKKGDSTEYRVTSREDQLQTASGSAAVGYNHIDYSYTGDYAAYFGTDELRQAYRYSHTSTTSDHQSTTYVFNRMNQLLSTEVSADGLKKTTENEEFHSLFNLKPTRVKTTETDANGAQIYYAATSYNDWGGVQSQTDNMPSEEFNQPDTKTKHTVNYTYEDTYKQLISKTWYQNNNKQLSEQYTYTNLGRLQSTTNAAGETTTYTYESSPANANQIQRITEQKQVRDGVNARSVTVFGAEYGYAYPTEKTSTFTNYNKTTKTVRQTMTYDSGTGLLTEQADSDGNKTITSYDVLGRPIKVVQPSMTNVDGTVYSIEDQYTYTNRAYSTEADSTNAGILTLRVDSLRQYTNKTTGVVTVLNRQASYYDGLGFLRVEETYNESNGWTRSQYHPDPMGRTIYAVDALGNTQTATYDAWGQQKEYSDAQGNLYVTQNQLTQRKMVRFAVASSEVGNYRNNVNNPAVQLNYVEQSLDAYGHVEKTTAYRDGASRNEPLQETYTYDLTGNVLSYTDPNGNRNSNGVTTSYTYDALNRLTLVQDAMDQSSRYTYDGLGGLSSVILSNNSGKSETLYTKNYNEQGLLTDKADAAGSTTRMNYNQRGLTEQLIDRNGTTAKYTYDERGQQTSAYLKAYSSNSLMSGTLETKSIYGADGNLLTDRHELYINDAKVSTQTSTIDKLDRITSLTSTATGYTARLDVGYDPLDRIANQKHTLNGTSFFTNYGYDKSRLTQVQTNGAQSRNTANTANVRYAYTPLGQVQQITFPTLSDGSKLQESMSYDPLNRLSSLTNTKGDTILSVYSYQYDNNGNITSVTEQVQNSAAQTSTYSYDKLNRLSDVKRADGSETQYGYDLSGNRLTQSDTRDLPDETAVNYRYNLQNTLISATTDKAKTLFDYLPDGLRWKKTTGSKVTQYSYNGADQVIGDKASNGTVSSYVRGDRVLVKKDLTNQKDYYYLYNGHGDVVQMIGTDGSVVNSYQYDEWGSLTQQKETVGNEFKYAGETYDTETGLYYLKARYYDPAQGRFLNEDTVEGQIDSPLSLNMYTYVSNNPFSYIDPTGNAQYGSMQYGNYAHHALGTIFKIINLFTPKDVAFTEVHVNQTNGKNGRVDLLLKTGANQYEVYEIKPMSYHNNSKKQASAQRQLNRYVTGINVNGVRGGNASAVKGTTFNPNNLTINDPYNSNKLIRYRTFEDEPGMIYYESIDNPNPQKGFKVVPEPKLNQIWDSISDFFDQDYHPDGVPLPNGLPPLGGNKSNSNNFFPIPFPRFAIF